MCVCVCVCVCVLCVCVMCVCVVCVLCMCVCVLCVCVLCVLCVCVLCVCGVCVCVCVCVRHHQLCGFGTWPDGKGRTSVPGHSEGSVAESSFPGPPPPSLDPHLHHGPVPTVGSEIALMGRLRLWG